MSNYKFYKQALSLLPLYCVTTSRHMKPKDIWQDIIHIKIHLYVIIPYRQKYKMSVHWNLFMTLYSFYNDLRRDSCCKIWKGKCCLCHTNIPKAKQ